MPDNQPHQSQPQLPADERRLGERVRGVIRTRGFLMATLVAILVAMYLAGLATGASAQRLLALTAWGLMLGGIIALGSIGLTLIYGVMKFPNFSHGALVTLGAYVAYTLIPLLPTGEVLRPLSFGYEFLIALVLAMPVVGVVAMAIDRVVYRRLRNTGAHLVLFAMASLAMAFFVQSMIYLIWGPDFHFYYPGRPNPALYLPFGIRVRADQLFILLLALVLVAMMYVLLEWTRMGKAMRATADNPHLAQIRGINTERVIAWTWVLGGGLAAAGGIMYGLSSQLRPEMGFWLLLPMFAATIMGGIGNPYGALSAALMIGIAHQVSTSFLDPTYGPAVAFVLMVVTLLIRPQGLLGRTER
ncbi:branched-chain amino acid ABC transporter permease [Halomonas sp. M5N1S17]|uniref:branched-chain amino acid ABC transporter permease n=1 Tax=Halomonas alkalisoli TaxID=2907158 RepID=UPI001F16304F|nr:branched-chain amino acid ABC transporter permease [Halomonas alkalisoli]MCE9664968.1 branched-chain amino acid ABC transporter permease [Halomonas alkalisoli]